jgi:hypothetical protein
MSHDFQTHGLDGIALNRAAERRLAEQHANWLANTSPAATGMIATLRRACGDLLISAGRGLAGTTATRAGTRPDVRIDPAI